MATLTKEKPADVAPDPSGPATLPAFLIHQAQQRPDDTALREKHRGVWRETTWAGYLERAARVGVALTQLGVKAGDRVAVHAENRPEWLLADLGIQGIGAITVGIYPTSPAAEVEYLLGNSESVVLFADDEEQLDKALAVRERLAHLSKIVVIDPRNVKALDDPMVTTFEELEASAPADAAATWTQQAQQLDPAETAIIVYTSGTTGPPKGAMISHQNLVWAGKRFTSWLDAGPADEVLSYLPLCHVAERLTSVIDALVAGYTVNFGEGGESFGQDMRDVQPTLFLGVPRVWEKMLAAVEIRMADASWLKRRSYAVAKRIGADVAPKRMAGQLGPADRVRSAIAWSLALGALRHKLGLGRVRSALCGAAPIAPQVLEYFWAMGVPVREGYGMTENTAACTVMPDTDIRIGTVGTAYEGVEIKIAEDGEILTRSPGVFVGYWKNPEATAQTIDPDGWLHTGDVGELDADGFLRITDRKKDIIITAGGKNISPSEIENKLKISPYVREAVVIGDRRKYLSALIGIELDTVGDWATRRGIPFTTYGDLAAKPEVRELIGQVVEETNKDFAQVETIKRYALLRKELDHEDGELTATMKVRRRAMEERFKDVIESELYG